MTSSAELPPQPGLRASLLPIAAWLALFSVFFVVYLLTNRALIHSGDFADYPFGTDAPRYVYGLGNEQLHPLTAELLRIWRGVLDALSIEKSPLVIKLPFAAVGALNVCLAAAAFRTVFDRSRSFIYAAIYGCTLSVWYFSATPESYPVSTFFYSLYLLAFLQAARHGMTTLRAAMMAVALFVALFNDVSAVLLPIVPLTYYRLKAWNDSAVRTAALVQIAALAAGLALLAVSSGILGEHIGMLERYTPLAADDANRPNISFLNGLVEATLNFFFFGIAAPTSEVTYATALFPDYVGYFQPSLAAYFSHPAPILFLVAYLGLISFIRISRMTRLAIACIALVVVRWLATTAFNPGEAILYVSPIMLALLLFFFHFLEASGFRHKAAFGAVLLATVLATNTLFFA